MTTDPLAIAGMDGHEEKPELRDSEAEGASRAAEEDDKHGAGSVADEDDKLDAGTVDEAAAADAPASEAGAAVAETALLPSGARPSCLVAPVAEAEKMGEREADGFVADCLSDAGDDITVAARTMLNTLCQKAKATPQNVAVFLAFERL